MYFTKPWESNQENSGKQSALFKQKKLQEEKNIMIK